MYIALLIPLLGTILGSAFVFFMKEKMSDHVQKSLLGFASGVMVAASVWSLLIPGMDMCEDLLLIDRVTPHLHIGNAKPEGPRSRLSRTAMLTLAVTIHNLPEGMGVGVVLAGAMQGDTYISTAAATAMAVGIAIQNIPEGAIISMPMRSAGNSKMRSFAMGALSGLVEPLGGLIVIILASITTPALPYLLAFAAGSMLYVVVEELIPEMSEGEHSNIGTIGFAVGFTLMMILDVVLG